MLQAFLYVLMRDHLVPGEIEKLVSDLESNQGPYSFSNKFLESYALELSKRLNKGD